MENITLTPPSLKYTRHTLQFDGTQFMLVQENRLALPEGVRKDLVAFLCRVKNDMLTSHRVVTDTGLTFRYMVEGSADIKIFKPHGLLVAAMPLTTAWRLLAELVAFTEVEAFKTEELNHDPQ